MTRRTALKLFGVMIACLVGKPVAKAADMEVGDWWKTKPMDYIFSEEGIGNIIIEPKDGEKLIIPFSDIVKALKEEDT